MNCSPQSICSNINAYSLDKLARSKQIKPNLTVLRDKVLTHNKNTNSMNVVSPFYDKSKCSTKGPCFCPFHRLKTNIFKKVLKN